MERTCFQIHPNDNVAVALRDLPKGSPLAPDFPDVVLSEDIPMGHKAALREIPAGAPVIKYGFPIGRASRPIEKGAWVHSHNLSSAIRASEQYEYHPVPFSAPAPAAPAFFSGYRRKSGRAGIRNEVWILPTVGCVAPLAERLARAAEPLSAGRADAVTAFSHPYGCSQAGGDEENTQNLLASLACHPNAGGVLVLGLGCENSGVEKIRARMGDFDPDRVRFLKAQDCGDEFSETMAVLEELLAQTARDRREPIPASELVVGLKCGGSDGFSGLTANPLVGRFSDHLCALGGATILTEVPEMFGAEALLMDRCADESLFRQAVELIGGFKDYYTRHDTPVSENPSPGNRAGGITTLEEKSLGCVQKAGHSPVLGVVSYGERALGPGLHLLQSPGNDLVSATALSAAGAHMVLFTTGRGTPFGCPVPTVKISTNSGLAARKGHWIDFDAGSLLAGEPPEALEKKLFEKVLATASGTKTRSEEAGYREMAIFKDGVTL